MIKYPKTPRTSPDVPEEWFNLTAVVEEKIDGANSCIRFEQEQLVLQSRGHELRGGTRERLFGPMWPWAYERYNELYKALGERFAVFGEWVYAKNRIFYDNLPDIFIAFDVWDKEQEYFLATPQWRDVLPESIAKVEMLWKGSFRKVRDFNSLITHSKYKTDKWKERYNEIMSGEIGNFYSDKETDQSDLMEGVYIRIEDSDKVVGRMKLPRVEFEKIHTDDAKWGRRPFFLNEVKK